MPFLLLMIGLTTKNELGIAGDYSNQRYTITDTTTRDTSDISTELRTFWSFYLSSDKSGQNLQSDNGLYLSTTSLRDHLNFNFSTDLNRLVRLTTEYDGELRYCHNRLPIGGETLPSPSYLNNNFQLKCDLAPSRIFSFVISENLEFQHYLPTDSCNYNYSLNRTGIGVNVDASDLSQFTMNYNYNRLWAQNQTGRDYLEHILTLDWDNYLGIDRHLTLNNQFSRRIYFDRISSYWEETPSLSFSWTFSPAMEVTLDENLRFTYFDETSVVYQNQVENRLGLGLESRVGECWTFRCGPQVELTRSLPRHTAQDYQEIALLLGVDLFQSSRFWGSVDDRFGKRRYLFADSGFQSDYRFNEFSFLGNWNIITTSRGGLSLQMMASIAPEWHQETVDNLAAATYSLEMKYSW